jgi:hypothetical protein
MARLTEFHRQQDPSDEPPGGDGEATLVEGHKRDYVPPGQTKH